MSDRASLAACCSAAFLLCPMPLPITLEFRQTSTSNALETGGLLFLLFRIIRDKPQDMPLCRIHAAVQENGSDHCLKGICQNGRTGSAAGMLFALAQQQKFAQVDLLGENVQRLFTDHRCPELGQLALRQFRILVKQELGNHDGQHAVSQEFQALVALACLALFVGIR